MTRTVSDYLVGTAQSKNYSDKESSYLAALQQADDVKHSIVGTVICESNPLEGTYRIHIVGGGQFWCFHMGGDAGVNVMPFHASYSEEDLIIRQGANFLKWCLWVLETNKSALPTKFRKALAENKEYFRHFLSSIS